VLQDCVQKLAYATVTARTGVAGLAAVRADPPPDAVLLDIAMPRALDGVKTLQAIKAHHPDLPVIMVTANADVAVPQATLRDDALDCNAPHFAARRRELSGGGLECARTPIASPGGTYGRMYGWDKGWMNGWIKAGDPEAQVGPVLVTRSDSPFKLLISQRQPFRRTCFGRISAGVRSKNTTSTTAPSAAHKSPSRPSLGFHFGTSLHAGVGYLRG